MGSSNSIFFCFQFFLDKVSGKKVAAKRGRNVFIVMNIIIFVSNFRNAIFC